MRAEEAWQTMEEPEALEAGGELLMMTRMMGGVLQMRMMIIDHI